MPRGIPNAKRGDEHGMKFTTFNVPLQPNPKNVGSSYLKYESQTIYARNSKAKEPEAEVQAAPQARRGSNVIVIHPGSRWLRIGRASDISPVTVANAIARKYNCPVPPPKFVEVISRPEKGKQAAQAPNSEIADEYSVVVSNDDPVEAKIASIATSLRDRMRFYKLRVTTNAVALARSFNEQFKPEVLELTDSSENVDWIRESADGTVFHENVFRLSDPEKLGYIIKYPILGSKFNMRDYASLQEILGDIEAIWTTAMQEKLGISRKEFKDYSVVLIIPDIWDRVYVRELLNIIVVQMGFKRVCAQQESLAATYGAGLSNACVVDIGAVKTSIACVDDGLVIADTRMSLNMGGDDITEFLYVLLDRISFPYRDIDLARAYDWNMMEDMKARLCTLTENDVALNLFDFVVRRPDKPTEKYGLRAYDEVILAPMCIFEPRVVEFERKRANLDPISNPDVTDEIVEYVTDRLTHAMLISTQHLMPAQNPGPSPPVLATADITPGELPAPNLALAESATAAGVVLPPAEPIREDAPDVGPSETAPAVKDEEASQSKEEVVAVKTEAVTDVDLEMRNQPSANPSTHVLEGAGSEQLPIVIQEVPAPVDVNMQQAETGNSTDQTPNYLGNLPIDVVFEASKLPLDVAIFNSARAAGGDEKIRKYLQAVLVIGGTACLSGMAHALESRLQAIATPLVHNMEKVQIIPPPKEIDPRVLAWKGASVLGKMDGVADLWVNPVEWEILGMRALKERCFYL